MADRSRARHGFQRFGPAQHCARVGQVELANHLSLEVMAPPPGLDQGHVALWAQDCDGKAGKPSTGANIGQRRELGQLCKERGGVENQSPHDLVDRPMALRKKMGSLVSLCLREIRRLDLGNNHRRIGGGWKRKFAFFSHF